jgi:hypothetical protein
MIKTESAALGGSKSYGGLDLRLSSRDSIGHPLLLQLLPALGFIGYVILAFIVSTVSGVAESGGSVRRCSEIARRPSAPQLCNVTLHN